MGLLALGMLLARRANAFLRPHLCVHNVSREITREVCLAAGYPAKMRGCGRSRAAIAHCNGGACRSALAGKKLDVCKMVLTAIALTLPTNEFSARVRVDVVLGEAIEPKTQRLQGRPSLSWQKRRPFLRWRQVAVLLQLRSPRRKPLQRLQQPTELIVVRAANGLEGFVAAADWILREFGAVADVHQPVDLVDVLKDRGVRLTCGQVPIDVCANSAGVAPADFPCDDAVHGCRLHLHRKVDAHLQDVG